MRLKGRDLMEEHMIKLRKQLQKLLVDHNLTIKDLSKETKVPLQTLHNWLAGYSPRNINQVKSVANYFRISVDYLLYGHLCTGCEVELKKEILHRVENCLHTLRDLAKESFKKG